MVSTIFFVGEINSIKFLLFFTGTEVVEKYEYGGMVVSGSLYFLLLPILYPLSEID